MASRTLLYFGYSPAEGAGSAIIVYRHLLRFAANGWKVHIVADFGQSDAIARQHDWPVMTLSHRKPWWPPFKPDQTLPRAYRAWLWAGEVHAWLDGFQPSGILTYLSAFSDTLSIAAAGYASRYRVPMAVIVHDDSRCFAESAEAGERAHARRHWILERSTKSWFASPGLAECFHLPPSRAGVLPPIPEGSSPALAESGGGVPLLIYAGNYWPPQVSTFTRLGAATRAGGGRFLAVLKENAEHVAHLQEQGVEWRAPFARNVEALDYFRTHATALVVSYSDQTADMPWTRTSFPSKLIEYCHLSLPIVIVAREDTAVVRWARERTFPDVFAPDDMGGFTGYVTSLQNAEFRRERASLARSFACGEFDPVAIQRQLEDSLLAPIS
ncbi:MAG: hypothetical protein ABIZ56_08090 [Chthoniobacteraceae bacterium]